MNTFVSRIGELRRASTKAAQWCLFPLLLIASSPSIADTLEDQVVRLEATIKTLTLQNADLIKENENLRKQMSEAITARREGKAVVSGCDIAAISKVVTFEPYVSNAARKAETWLKSEGERCSDQQLRQISKELNTWLKDQSGGWGENSQAIISFILKYR